MKKLTVEIEFDKYTPFGRTHCTANKDIYEDYFTDEKAMNNLVEYVKKLFNNMNLFDQMATFIYRDTDYENYSQRHYVCRAFTVGHGCTIDKVVYDDANHIIEQDVLAKMGKKEIMAMIDTCMERMDNPTYYIKGVI